MARVRFAHSPIHELAASLLVPQDPCRRPMYDSWLSSVRLRLGDLRLKLLTALAPTGRYLPGFLFPVPGVPRPGFADELEVVAAIAILPVWPRLRAVCSHDLTYRMERFVDGGLACVLADLHPELAMEGDRLRIDKPHHCHQSFDLAGVGIVVVPCAFAWPCLMVDLPGPVSGRADHPARTIPTDADRLLGRAHAVAEEHL